MGETTTGVVPADEFITWANELGLSVKHRVERKEADLYPSGEVMLAGRLFIHVDVCVPVPEELKHTLGGMDARAERVSFSYVRYDDRGRGRFIGGMRYTPFSTRKIGSPGKLQQNIRLLAYELDRLNRKVAAERAALAR